MELYYSIVFFIFGTIFGSFFHVVGTRLPNGESIVSPPSHCTNCNHRLKPIELIPIFSFLIQGGKCKICKQKLSWFYPIYEILTGILFGLCYHAFGLSLELLFALTFVSILMILIISDYYYMILPDSVMITGIILLGIEIFIIHGGESFLRAIGSGIGTFLIMYLIKLFGDFLFKKESMGGGDIKLLFLFGMVLGIPMSVISIFLASFLALPIALIILYKEKTNIIPFGPFLSISAMLLFLSRIDIDLVIKILSRQ